MAVKISVYLPKESIENIDSLSDLIGELGNIVARDFGNTLIMENPDAAYLESIDSFIIISSDNIPEFKNLHEQEAYLVIPIEGEE